MSMPFATAIRNFFIPKLNRYFFLRLATLTLLAWLFFSQLCIPAFVNGDSMLPTYQTGNLLFCWTLAFRNQPPQTGEVVMIAYPGKKVMLLKRVVATEGQTVQFNQGKLLIDGKPLNEPWTDSSKCDWNSQPVTVRTGCVFVVGDNRSMPESQHRHGEVGLQDILGKPLHFLH